MALFNEILSGRYNRALQKLFSMKGEPPSPQLSGEVMPIHPFFNGVENRYLEGWERFGFALNQIAGSAGQFSKVQLRNPSGSNVVAVVERLYVIDGTAIDPGVNIRMRITADLATTFTPTNIDSRTRAQSTCIPSREPNVTVGGTPLLLVVGALNDLRDQILTDDAELVILPGDGVMVASSIAQHIISVGFVWRERPLEDSEKT